MTPLDYIIHLRIEHACSLFLHKPALSVTEVAIQSGFNHPNYFYRVFKKRKGISPYTYKTHSYDY